MVFVSSCKPLHDKADQGLIGSNFDVYAAHYKTQNSGKFQALRVLLIKY
jgi:hypothetical protein